MADNSAKMNDAVEPQEVELSPDQLKEIRAAFELVDADKDGFIDQNEMTQGMRIIMQAPTEQQTKDIFQEMDRDNHGVIDLDDFMNIMSRHLKTPDDCIKTLQGAFAVMDKDKSGRLDVKEFKNIMTSMGDVLSDQEVDELLKELTVDREGRLDVEEFIGVVMRK